MPMHTFQREDSMISAAGVIDHEAQYGDDDYLCYADHRSDNLNTDTKSWSHQNGSHHLLFFTVILDHTGCG